MALWRKSFSCLCRKNPEFQVDFYEYPKEDATITFHFPVYTSNVVVMNSIQKGLWNEKNIAFSGSFVTGKSFELKAKAKASATHKISLQTTHSIERSARKDYAPKFGYHGETGFNATTRSIRSKDLVQEPACQMEEAATAANAAMAITRTIKPDPFSEGGGDYLSYNYCKHSSTVDEIDEFVKIYDLPGEDDTSSLNQYLFPVCLEYDQLQSSV
ncbi:hypothetical protein H8959_006615 [Pygathrix nigripes]